MSGAYRVLYIDDDVAMVRLVTAQLDTQGISTTGHTSPEAGIAAFAENPDAFDIAITDYNMPRLSGARVAEELTRIRKGFPVLVFSGYVTEEMRSEAARAGAQGVIYKPNTVEELLEAIVLALAR